MPLHLPRRRTLAKIGLFLLAGAGVNVGVAWGCSAVYIGTSWNRLARDFPLRWPLAVPDEWPPPQDAGPSYDDAVQIGADFRHYTAYIPEPERGTPSDAKIFGVTEVRSGLPLRSMQYFDVESPAPPRSEQYPEVKNELVGGIAVRSPGYMAQGALPLIPLWPGAIVNTVCFAALLYAPIGLLGRHRRSRRLARGLCPRCTYDIRGLDACPECGAAIRRKAATS